VSATGNQKPSEVQLPWHARARQIAQTFGVEPKDFRRVRWLHKARIVRGCDAGFREKALFVLWDPEPHNFTYEIANEDDLAYWVQAVARTDEGVARARVREPASDAELHARLRRATSGRWRWSKRSPPFGKRLGWYALVRLLRPNLVVETGVHDGLGSLLLLRALERNLEEGHAGHLVSFDVNPSAGWLVGSHPHWTLRLEASEQGLPRVLDSGREIGMFIYDGWHSYDSERAELEAVLPHLGPTGVLLSDDAQVTGALAAVCEAHGLEYLTVNLIPRKHFHPGSTLAAGLNKERLGPVHDVTSAGKITNDN
jgi:Methyltransferase domain